MLKLRLQNKGEPVQEWSPHQDFQLFTNSIIAMQDHDFTATLQFSTAEAGGRDTAVLSGYRPIIEFEHYPEYLTSGQQEYLDKTAVGPGETVQAAIKIIGTDYFTGRLYSGKKFRFCEGSRVIGHGIILHLLNPALAKADSAEEASFNLNLYAPDIVARIKNDFGEANLEAIQQLQHFLLHHEHGRSQRLIRAMIFLAEKSSSKLKKAIKAAQIDYRDVLFWAEYDDKSSVPPKRVRDFNQVFGRENLLK